MELLYVWIQEYGNIKRQGFNFSGKYDISFDYEENEKGEISGKLKIEDKENPVPDGFFGENISSVTAIVGKNGSGKSTLLELLIKSVYDGDLYFLEEKYEFFMVIKIDCKTVVFKTNKIEIICSEKFEKEDRFSIKGGMITNRERLQEQNYTYIYYDNIFNENYKQIKMYQRENISTMYNLINHDDPSKKLTLKEHLDNFSGEEIINELELLVKEELKEINVSRVLIYLDEDNRKYFKKEFEINLNDFPESILFDSYLLGILRREIEKNGFEYNFKTLDENTVLKEEVTLENYSKILNEIERVLNKIDYSIFNDEAKVDFKENIRNIKEIFESFYKNLNSKIVAKNAFIDIKAFSLFLKKEDMIDFLKLVKIKYMKESNGHNKIQYLSTGEKAFLRIFVRLNGIHKIEDKNIILLMDEPDIFMHPEWQRNLISMLTKFLNENFSDKTIQIILTSHSPFVTSDLPRENIIFLDKDDDGMCVVKEPDKMNKTFAGNIHTLLSNAFFMESTTGEFAKEKIAKVMELLDGDIKDIREKEDYIKFVINAIGEPILKHKLQSMLEDKLKLDLIGVDEKIKTLEEQIKELKEWKEQQRKGDTDDKN